MPERLAFGTNLNGFRQESTEHGFEVLLGDLVRPKEFLFEVTTPVPLDGDELMIGVRAAYRDMEDAARESVGRLALRVCDPDEAERVPVDEDVIAKLLVQLPARAEMDATLAHEAGDLARARAVVDASHRAMGEVRRFYGAATAGLSEMESWEARLSDLSAATLLGPMPAVQLKAMYALGYDLSRSRPHRPM
jgi:hypothetical protein